MKKIYFINVLDLMNKRWDNLKEIANTQQHSMSETVVEEVKDAIDENLDADLDIYKRQYGKGVS